MTFSRSCTKVKVTGQSAWSPERKISPIWGLTVDSSQLTFVLTSKSRNTKTRPNIEHPARWNFDIVP